MVFALMGVEFVRWQTLPWFLAQCDGLIYTPGLLRKFAGVLMQRLQVQHWRWVRGKAR